MKAHKAVVLRWLILSALVWMPAAFIPKPIATTKYPRNLGNSHEQLPSVPLRLPPNAAAFGDPATNAITATSLLMSRVDLQGTRDLVQGGIYSFVSALPVRLGAALLGSLASGSLIGTFTNVIEKGKARAGEGEGGMSGGSLVVPQLYLCLALDLLGDASYLVPGIGEAEDILWAPISAAILMLVFKSRRVAVLDFAKELLPFVDIVPVATLSWLLQNAYPDSAAAGLLGLSPLSTSDGQSNSRYPE